MIRFSALGVSEVRLPDGSAVPGLASKRLALLAYLALARPRGFHRRDTLLGLLWPESSQEKARNALRQTLHPLRAALGEGIVLTRGAAEVAVDAEGVRCDAIEFEELLRAGRTEEALALYHGDLLPGLFVAEAPGFEDWLSRERSRLRELAAGAGWSLVAASADPATRAGWVRWSVALSPLDELATRRGMDALRGVGDSAGALALYEELAQRLERELDTRPSPETEALAAELQRHPAAGAVRSPSRADEAAAARQPLPRPPVRPARSGRRATLQWGAAAAVVAGLVVLAAYLLPEASRAEPGAREPERVQVQPFDNLSGSPELDDLARIGTAAVRGGLSSLEGVEVMAEGTPAGASRGAAVTVVAGMVFLRGDSVVLQAQISDPVRGLVLREIPPVSAPRTQGSRAVEELEDRVKTAVATMFDPRFAWPGTLSRPPSFAAYRSFLRGMEALHREEPAAAPLLLEAFSLDSTFTLPALLAAATYLDANRFAIADSLARRLAARRGGLPPVDAHLLTWLQARLSGNRSAAVRAMRSVTAATPENELAQLQLALDELAADRAEAAREILEGIDPEEGFIRGWPSFWATRAEALHVLGDHRRELRVIRDGQRRHPTMNVLVDYELRALAALGRTRELERRLDESASLPPGQGWHYPTALLHAAQELRAHGHAEAIDGVGRRAAAWSDLLSPAERTRLMNIAALGELLYVAGYPENARRVLAPLGALSGCPPCRGMLGVLAAQTGNRQEAEAHARELSAMRSPYLHGMATLWRARIAAALGDSAGALLRQAFAEGLEHDALLHTDPLLAGFLPRQP